SNAEWARFTETWLDKPSDGIVEKTRKIHDDHIHDFVFDDGRIQNIYLLDAYSGQFDRAIRFYLTGRSGLKMTATRPPSHHFRIYYCLSFWSTVSASLRRLSPFRLKTIAPPMRRSQMASATVGSGIRVCQSSTGYCDVTSVELFWTLSSSTSIRSAHSSAVMVPMPKSSRRSTSKAASRSKYFRY